MIGNLLSLPSRYWSIGPAIAQAIFDAGLRSAQKAQAIATYDETVANYRSTVLTALPGGRGQSRGAVDPRAGSGGAGRRGQGGARIGDDRAQSIPAGTANYLAVVVLQAAALNSERTALAILGRRLTASVGLIKALGGGWNASQLTDAAS